MARAMYEPTPGKATDECPTLIDSEATTKNQPPDIDSIMFHTSAGMPNGTSSCQNRIQGESRKDSAASIELGRDRAQRLIEAERHIPRLAGEYGEDRREFRAEHAPGRQRQEKNGGHRNETQNRHRLQDIENRHQELARTLALGGPSRVGESKDQREEHRRQHAKRGARSVFRQMRGIQRKRR